MGVALAAKGHEGSQHLRTGSNPNSTIRGQVHIGLGVTKLMFSILLIVVWLMHVWWYMLEEHRRPEKKDIVPQIPSLTYL